MELKEAIERRQSIRKFLDKPISIDKIKNLLYYANLAPSAGNLQARDFIIVKDKEKKKELVKASYGQSFIYESPVVVIFCANLKRISPYGERGKKLYCIQDVSASIQNFLLVALDEGLATCWIGAFNEKEVSRILKLPSFIKPLAIVPVGYAGEKPYKTDRIDIEKLIHYEEW